MGFEEFFKVLTFSGDMSESIITYIIFIMLSGETIGFIRTGKIKKIINDLKSLDVDKINTTIEKILVDNEILKEESTALKLENHELRIENQHLREVLIDTNKGIADIQFTLKLLTKSVDRIQLQYKEATPTVVTYQFISELNVDMDSMVADVIKLKKCNKDVLIDKMYLIKRSMVDFTSTLAMGGYFNNDYEFNVEVENNKLCSYFGSYTTDSLKEQIYTFILKLKDMSGGKLYNGKTSKELKTYVIEFTKSIMFKTLENDPR